MMTAGGRLHQSEQAPVAALSTWRVLAVIGPPAESMQLTTPHLIPGPQRDGAASPIAPAKVLAA
jgi:hypothetical protein